MKICNLADENRWVYNRTKATDWKKIEKNKKRKSDLPLQTFFFFFLFFFFFFFFSIIFKLPRIYNELLCASVHRFKVKQNVNNS